MENKLDNELVSIIMPSYNTAMYIKFSIESVLAQTYRNWELIIVDDCSTDNTDEVVKQFLIDKRIKYFKNTKNSGAALTRNKALRMAKDKWIAFLDSDDLWKPEKLDHQISCMKKNRYHFTYTNYIEIDENGRRNGVQISGPKRITQTGMYNYCWPGCLTVMYDREYIGLIQIKDIKKNNDYAIWLQICKKTDCYLLNEYLAKYRIRQKSISHDKISKKIKSHYDLFRICDERTKIASIYLTVNNLFFGLIKKLIYERSKD